MHRSIAQIKDRAPNSSPAYISTETRLPAFHKLFESPLAVQELAARHADLDSGQAVAQAVAMLVGGKSCRAARGIKHAELVKFLYHGAFKFSRGKTATEVLPQSVADKLRRQKTLGPTTILKQTCIPLYCLAMFLLYNVYMMHSCSHCLTKAAVDGEEKVWFAESKTFASRSLSKGVRSEILLLSAKECLQQIGCLAFALACLDRIQSVDQHLNFAPLHMSQCAVTTFGLGPILNGC